MTALLHAWILAPVALAAVLGGLGLLVDRLAGRSVPGVLIGPLGLAALIVVAALTTAAPALASATTPVVAVLAVVGLALGHRRVRPRLVPTLALLVVFLAYGAPVILSGQATFAGYLRLDDTATWLTFTDHVLDRGRSLDGLPSSTYAELLRANLTIGYPLGAFPPLGVASELSGVDEAWVFAPYLACCGALVAASILAVIEPLGFGTRLRAVVAAAAAQPALLFGYVQWGGIKEITVAAGVLLVVALAAPLVSGPPERRSTLLPLAVASGALLAILGPGGVAFFAPVFLVVAVGWFRAGRAAGELRAVVVPTLVLGGLTLLLALPTLVALADSLGYGKAFFDEARDRATLFGNLIRPVQGWQLGGVWFARDFRVAPDATPTIVWLVVVGACAVVGLVVAMRAKLVGLPLYVGLALLAVGASAASGASPWLMGKTLSIAAPAIPLAALCGAGWLAVRHRAGLAVVALLVFGIAWSNVLTYSNVTLAPRDRLAELQEVAKVVAGQGPTFDNEYEVYAARHFLREGATVQPAELRAARLPVIDGRFLIQPAVADLDAFPPSTLAPYRSVIVPRSPTSSRPSSEFEEVWTGEHHVVYRRTGAGTLVRHVPFGDSRSLPYCGNSQNAGPLPLCAVQPIQVPTCRVVRRLGAQAARVGGSLVAAVREAPVVLRGDEVQWPGTWIHDVAARTLTPTEFGTAVTRVGVATTGRYEFWLGGAFARGFEVKVDGRPAGRVHHQLSSLGGNVRLPDLRLTAGAHTIELTYPQAGNGPGDADESRMTVLRSITLQPRTQTPQLLTVPAADASSLCGRPVDWIDIVR